MSTAQYSLLTLRPDPERVDVICVGAVVLADGGKWHAVVPPAVQSKLAIVGVPPSDTVKVLPVQVQGLVARCSSLEDAQAFLGRVGGSLQLHPFIGVFAYASDAEFQTQLQAIAKESVIAPALPGPSKPQASRAPRRNTRARLKQHFDSMGILAKNASEFGEHKVVRNFPVSLHHGLVAEFALKNSVMHVTETVDFDVDSVRTKTFEAQAKCLVMRAAKDNFGGDTECYVVVSGSETPHAARTVDLLSTVGRVFATENDADMREYLERIAKAARAAGQLGA
jgi:hypothetical protein